LEQGKRARIDSADRFTPTGGALRSGGGPDTVSPAPIEKSQLRRRSEIEIDVDIEIEIDVDIDGTTRTSPVREPGFLAEDPVEGVPTPRPKMPLTGIPFRVMSERELFSLPLDHRAGFLLANIDGATSIQTIIDLCGMPHDETVELISRLIDLRVVTLK
jgi:hypothetical protein